MRLVSFIFIFQFFLSQVPKFLVPTYQIVDNKAVVLNEASWISE